MNVSAEEFFQRRLQGIVAGYSFGWLLAANLVGLWLATVLIVPEWGNAFGELTYGRWMPLHMDWQLYGWCSLPLVGLLAAFYLRTGDAVEAHVGFLAWSLALILGGVLSLQGVVSGKLFLNWSGLGRVAFPTAQVVLWLIVAAASWRRWKSVSRWDRVQLLQIVLLVVLIASPIGLFIAAGRDVYPPIDPESGGATGHSLLASSLGIIGIFGFLPLLLRAPRKNPSSRIGSIYAESFLASILVWALIDHGNASDRSWAQILGLGVLVIWVPLLVRYFRSFLWPAGLTRWVSAFLAWWGALTLTGFLTFLPHFLDILKFTNGMVAHAHLAMAGMVGALNFLVLGSLSGCEKGDPWADGSSFWLWQIGVGVYVLAMWVQGAREGVDPMILVGADSATRVLYAIRWGGGLFMIVANLRWIILLAQQRRTSKASIAVGEREWCDG